MWILCVRAVALFILFAGAAGTGIVAPGRRRLVSDGRVLQLVTRHEPPLSIFSFEQTSFPVALVFAPLRSELRFERHERLVVVDLFRLDDFQSTPVGGFGPLANERKIDFFARACMSRGNDEVDVMRHKSRIPGAHQFFGRLTFARAVDNRLTTLGEENARTARADFVIFSHRPSLHTGAMMRHNRRPGPC